jgi:UDP-N-acetylmuramoylalanine-D-glutamate ligase
VKVLAEHNVQEIILLDDMSRLRFKHPCSVVNFSGMDIEDLNRELGKVVHGLVKEGRCGLFSPGGTSFNMFSNFEVRGEWFKNLMKKSTSK